jgi:hypothetical protein
MHTKNSNKLPFLLAAGAVGGAVGYLFFTDSGRRKLDSISQGRVDVSGKFPDKIDRARRFVEINGKNVTAKVQGLVERVKGAYEAGQRSHTDALRSYEGQISRLQRSNEEVVANLHRAVDSLGKLMETGQNTLIGPFHEAGALAQAVRGWVRSFLACEKTGSDSNRPMSFQREEYRVIR